MHHGLSYLEIPPPTLQRPFHYRHGFCRQFPTIYRWQLYTAPAVLMAIFGRGGSEGVNCKRGGVISIVTMREAPIIQVWPGSVFLPRAPPLSPTPTFFAHSVEQGIFPVPRSPHFSGQPALSGHFGRANQPDRKKCPEYPKITSKEMF